MSGDFPRGALDHVAGLSSGGPIDPSLRVTLNFHPDRLIDGIPLLRALERDGIYRSQFETGTSNGGLTAHPGGDRWRWESRMFGGAYDDLPATDRPKYGSLNYRRSSVGGSPRFGSAYFRLTGDVLERTTFCYPDSVFEPVDFGVAARMSLIAKALNGAHDALDDYIEAHVHGPVHLAADVEALVLDPCYQDTDVERLARRLPCPLEWHEGFSVAVETLRANPDYRGPQYVALGIALARDGILNPSVIGDASRAGRYDDQALKRVWHFLARFGAPSFNR